MATYTNMPTSGRLAYEVIGYSEAEEEAVEAKYYEIVDRLLAEVTGDQSLSYYPYTSEILYVCRGFGPRRYEPLKPWRCDELDLEAISEQAWQEADEWGVTQFGS